MRFLQQRDPNIPKLQNSISLSILNQITSHKAQNSSFFILFHLHRSKLQKTPPNGRTIEETKGGGDFIRSHRNSKPRNIQSSNIPPSISSPMLFCSEEQRIQYNSLFSSHYIIDPKFVDIAFFDDEIFDCFQAFQNSGLIQFISMKLLFLP